MRCAHISDLHFSDLRWRFSYLFSKKWVGYGNLLLKRHREYSSEYLPAFKDLLKQSNISHVFITGDLTSIIAKREIQAAERFISSLKQDGYTVFVLPGNHDKYTRQSTRQKEFYRHFENFFPSHLPYTLKEDGVAAYKLDTGWWAVGLDTAVPTSLVSSCGLFSKFQEEKLREVLEKIPKHDKILLLNHYPFFQNESPRKILKRGKALQSLLIQYPNIELYLHGHTHRHTLADLHASQLPIILDSGSLSHLSRSSWNLIELQENNVIIQPFFQGNAPGTWLAKAPSSYPLLRRSS